MKALTISALWLCMLLPFVSSAHTQPLKDFMNSKEFAKYNKNPGGRGLLGPRWMKPGTSFYKLFAEPEGGLNLLDWLGVSATGLSLSTLQALKAHEYIGAERVLLTKELTEIKLTALVPHPKFKDTVQTGLVEKFASLEPPKLRIVYSKQVLIQGQRGTLFESVEGACSLFFRFDRGSVVNLSVKSCSHEDQITALAEKLDFPRMIERINS